MAKIEKDPVAHMGFVQGVINRMGSNALAMKALAATIAAGVIAVAIREGRDKFWGAPSMNMERRPAYWTHDDEAAKDVGHLYYFAPTNRAAGPYTKQRHVEAIIDIADDGTLAGVELISDMPPPPTEK